MYGKSLISNTVTRLRTFSYSYSAHLSASFFLNMNMLLTTALVLVDMAAMRENSLYSSRKCNILLLIAYVTGGILKASSRILARVSSSTLSVRLMSTTFIKSHIISWWRSRSRNT